MKNIKSYIILNKKTNIIINLFIYISLMIFITLLILLQLKFKKYYCTISQVVMENNTYKLTLYIYPYKLNIIKNNNELIIDNDKYEYKIITIDNEYTINNTDNYLKVVLDVNLSEKDKINNNILEVKILESNKKLFYYLKDYLMKGEKNEEN